MSRLDHENGECDNTSEGSCHSTVFYSTAAGGSYDEFRFELEEIKVCKGTVKDEEEEVEEDDEGVNVMKDCRICHMGLDELTGEVAMELGCSCKEDLAVAHKACAEQWFCIKGNKTCEICNSVARNVMVQNKQPETGQLQEEGNEVEVVVIPSEATTSEIRSCWQGHRFLNFLLGCMVFAFVVSWLLHFNVSE